MTDYNADYPEYQDHSAPEKSIKGYKVVIIILAVILAGLSFLFLKQTSNMKQEFAVERDTLINRLSLLRGEYDSLRVENDTISRGLEIQRHRADSVMERLTQERSWNAAKIRQYEKEVGTLRTVMRGFVQQIDSLNQLNRQLLDENVGMRRQVSEQRLRADKAEERAQELNTKVRKGSVIRARDISLLALNNSDRVVSRARQAARLRVDFVLASNELAQPGERNVYVRVTGPDGYVMANSANATFPFEGDMITYSATREIDYQNQDLAVSVYYSGGGITAGTYRVEIFLDGYLIGQNEVILR